MATASGLISSIQSISTNLLRAIRGTPSSSHQQQDPPSPVSEQQKSVRDLEKLSRMLARIQAVQQDAEEREIHDCSVRLWLAELRGVAYKAEDVLDEFYYEVQRSIVESGDAAIEAYHRGGGTKKKIAEMYASSSLASYSVTKTKASIPDGMAKEIKDITERFEEISDAREKLHLREEDGTRLVSSPQIRPPTSSHMDERATFGREEEKEKIISLMNPSTGPDFMVLPIVGMGGFGKTTLAQLVFNDSRIHGLFNKRCWVSVSDNFDLVQLTKALVNSLDEKGEKPCEFSELNILQDIFKEKISGHGLFLVLDDVWNEQRNLWERFRVGFLGAKFVRILTTTRNTSVAKIMQTTSHFQLSSLPEENCWSLFKHFAFDSREKSENTNLHEIGCGIVKKCKGSPLAIKALGGILRYEMDEEKWREILESDISDIDETGEIMPALKLSYQKLPQHLKPCFLYLSMFPKDFNFEKDMVIRLWMAQGYINGNTRNFKTLEEIGSEYFDELQGRSLVDGGPSSYVLHDLIHDLARSVSQEAYWPVVENDHGYNGVCKVCHLYFTKEDELLGLVPSTYRSIRTFGKECMLEEFDFSIFSEIACARALHLRDSSLPNTFGTFKHLRYLFVSSMLIKVLPETLCLLYNLQTLVLECDNLEELPKNMKNLINLRCFRLESMRIQHLPESIFPLPNLQTLLLSWCDLIKELPRGIEQSTRLHILGLPLFLTNVPSGIGKLPTLQQLWGGFEVMDHEINGWLRGIKDMNKLRGPLCISGLRNIVDVELCRNANLASKPNLHKLILNFQEDCGKKGFRNEELHLHVTGHSSNNAKSENDEKIHNVVLESLQPHGNLTELGILNYGGRNFPSWLHNPLLPKLTTLTLTFCTEPNYLPPFGQLPHLRFLEIFGGNLGDEPRTYSLWVEYDSSKQTKKPSYPSLKMLFLRNMLNLVEWKANDGDFPYLEKLDLQNCPELWKIPTIPQNVRDVTFKACPKLKFLTCPSVISNLVIMRCGFREIMFHSVSENLTISNCIELISINWNDGGLNSVREVSFEHCPKLELVTFPVRALKLKIHECGCREIKIESILESLTISNCVELISINWIDIDLNSFRKVSFEYCPKLELHVPVKDVLHSTGRVEIYDCPRLYLGKGYVYQRDTTIKELNLSGNNKIHSTIPLPENQFKLFLTKDDFREVESLTCAPSVGVSCQHVILNLASLVILEIMRCTKVISVTGLDNLSNLKRLSISSCPNLCNWNDRTLPLSLESLQLIYCGMLSSMPLLSVQNHSSTLKIIVIRKCPRLDELIKRYVYQRDTTIKELNLSGNNDIHLSDSTIPLLDSQFELFLTKKDFQEVESLTCAASVGVSCQHVILNLASLVILEIMRCTKVISVTGLDNLSNLKYLSISFCPELCNWNDKTLPQSLEFLKLDSCDKLSSLPLLSVQNHSSTLEVLVIKKCPRLDELGESYVYQRDTTIKRLNFSGNNEIHLSDSTIPLLENQLKLFLTKEDFWELESLTCAPSVGVSCQHVILNLASLVILEIMRCTNIISVTGLDNLSNLKCLSISFCPELCNWNDKTLPLSLKFLELNYCDKLSTLPLLSVQNHSSTLEVLVITMCPRLDELVDFHGLMKLKTVDIRHCRNISISLATESHPRPRINIGDCPLMRDWCQRNNITYNELIGNPQEDREAELESAEHESGEEEFGEQESAEIYECPRLYLGERYVYQRETQR
ncbi:putative disease resistance RPP13-like protein 1 [Carex rostrata]